MDANIRKGEEAYCGIVVRDENLELISYTHYNYRCENIEEAELDTLIKAMEMVQMKFKGIAQLIVEMDRRDLVLDINSLKIPKNSVYFEKIL